MKSDECYFAQKDLNKLFAQPFDILHFGLDSNKIDQNYV